MEKLEPNIRALEKAREHIRESEEDVAISFPNPTDSLIDGGGVSEVDYLCGPGSYEEYKSSAIAKDAAKVDELKRS